MMALKAAGCQPFVQLQAWSFLAACWTIPARLQIDIQWEKRMRFTVLIVATASLLAATPAAADIIEFHAGLAELDDEGLPEVREQEGRSYRLSAINFVEPDVYLLLEARHDTLDPTFAPTTTYTVPNTGGGTTPLELPSGEFEATRQMLRFGFGERWGSSSLSLGFELGAAMIKMEQSKTSVPVSATADIGNPGSFIVITETLSEETKETNGYYGLDLTGHLGSFEWKVDATRYLKVPELRDRQFIGGIEQQTWYGGNLAWYFDETTALGFRYEEAGGFTSATIFLRWRS